MRGLFIMLCAVLVLSGCKESNPQEMSKMKQVMAVHDELMPKMGEMGMLINELKQKADTTATGQKYAAAQQKLKDGYDGMMTWMQDFGKKFEADEILNGKALTPEKEALLDQEMTEVKNLEALMLSGIKEAKQLLGKE